MNWKDSCKKYRRQLLSELAGSKHLRDELVKEKQRKLRWKKCCKSQRRLLIEASEIINRKQKENEELRLENIITKYATPVQIYDFGRQYVRLLVN